MRRLGARQPEKQEQGALPSHRSAAVGPELAPRLRKGGGGLRLRRADVPEARVRAQLPVTEGHIDGFVGYGNCEVALIAAEAQALHSQSVPRRLLWPHRRRSRRRYPSR